LETGQKPQLLKRYIVADPEICHGKAFHQRALAIMIKTKPGVDPPCGAA
jgi:hypothetical protein